jgi:hypothetical protein
VKRASERDSSPPAVTRELPRRLVDDLLAAATTAPSIHNTQPWRFKVSEDTIELRADPERMLPIIDPAGRAVYLACGAALLNLRLAAAVAGHEPVVQPLPYIDDGLRGAQVKALVRGIESGLKHESEDVYRVDVVPIGGPQALP